MTGVRRFDAAWSLVVPTGTADWAALARLRVTPAPALVARLLAWLLLAPSAASIFGRLRSLLGFARAATARLSRRTRLVARRMRLAFRGWLRRSGLVPPGSQATLLRLLTSQLIVLAGRTVRLPATLVARLPTFAALAALAALTLVGPLLPLAGPLVGALAGLTVVVVTRLLFGPGRIFLGLVAGCVLGALIGRWPSPAAAALSGPLRRRLLALRVRVRLLAALSIFFRVFQSDWSPLTHCPKRRHRRAKRTAVGRVG